MPIIVNAYGVKEFNASAEPLAEPLEIKRRELDQYDVRIKIQWTGICGTDLHLARNDWGRTTYPIVPGHEILGTACEVGEKVTKVKVGDIVAVGCTVDSCRNCEDCNDDQEQMCLNGRISTYNSPDPYLPGQQTYGGFSEQVLVHEHFVILVPSELATTPEMLRGAAPLACAGVTTWAPLKRFGVTNGTKVGVAGLGGLGHLAVKLAIALGAQVTVISRTHKKDESAKRLGASKVISSDNHDELTTASRSLDLIIDTIPVDHDITKYLPLLRTSGTLVMVGHIGPLNEHTVSTAPMILSNRMIAGSFIGGVKQTQELFDFCALHKITADVEVVQISQINESWRRMVAGDVQFRFVIDIEAFRLECHQHYNVAYNKETVAAAAAV